MDKFKQNMLNLEGSNMLHPTRDHLSETKSDLSQKTKRLKVESLRHLSDSAFVIRLKRPDYPFVAGQCFNLSVPGQHVNREYSLYSGEGDPYVEFLIKEMPEGIVSPLLKRVKAGGELEVDGAYGLFVLREPEDKTYLFVGTGTGIAPFRSFVRTYPGLNYTLLHGLRYEKEAYDRDEYPSGRYLSCVSRESKGDHHGRVTDYLRSHPVAGETYCYLCGNRSMINDVYDILRSQRISGGRISTEVFF